MIFINLDYDSLRETTAVYSRFLLHTDTENDLPPSFFLLILGCWIVRWL